MPVHRLLAVVALGLVRVVGGTHQANVLGTVVNAQSIGKPVVILELATLGASSAL
jgi:hypothetical protein